MGQNWQFIAYTFNLTGLRSARKKNSERQLQLDMFITLFKNRRIGPPALITVHSIGKLKSKYPLEEQRNTPAEHVFIWRNTNGIN